jgi:signal transduction histidine kinase
MGTDSVLRRIGLRPRIAVLSAVAVGVTLGVGALLVVGVLRSGLEAAASNAAELRARDVAALAEAGTLPSRLALPGEESAFVQVVDDRGRVVASTENIDGEPAVSSVRPPEGRVLLQTMAIEPLDDSTSMRVAVAGVRTDGGPVVVYAGESLREVGAVTTSVMTLLVIGVPLLIALVAAFTWWAIGRTLRPVRDITHTMSEITTSDLHRRVAMPATRDEIGDLARTVNDTLERLDAAVATQRRFVADASHELRGPLAALRADLEISVVHPDRTEWSAVARGTLEDVERLERLTNDLLLLARLDAAQPRPHRFVDISAIATAAARAVRRRDVDVTTAGVAPLAPVSGDPDQLHRMMRNLVHNAEQHAAGRIEVAVEIDGSDVHIVVGDDGPGIPAGDRASVFERFVRLDSARARHTGGTGLGLAIVHDVATRHGGTVAITDREHGGSEFHVVIPGVGRSADASDMPTSCADTGDAVP